MDNLISRQAAIDLIDEYMEKSIELHYLPTGEGIKTLIFALSSAQPEIIRCKDCEHHGKEICYMWSSFYGTINTPDGGYCHKAERRTDEQTV